MRRRNVAGGGVCGAGGIGAGLATGPRLGAKRPSGSSLQADLRSLDPIWTTAYVTRNFGYMVYDTLFALDKDFKPQPQMVDTLDRQRRQTHLQIHPA